ncbi:MAG: hypothetical protein BYD32DRAFT_260413 [Podila humilis]|nr:MAG: hypothetical protein BYD32DRAFT_260413 [Podila humilis]
MSFRMDLEHFFLLAAISPPLLPRCRSFLVKKRPNSPNREHTDSGWCVRVCCVVSVVRHCFVHVCERVCPRVCLSDWYKTTNPSCPHLPPPPP